MKDQHIGQMFERLDVKVSNGCGTPRKISHNTTVYYTNMISSTAKGSYPYSSPSLFTPPKAKYTQPSPASFSQKT